MDTSAIAEAVAQHRAPAMPAQAIPSALTQADINRLSVPRIMCQECGAHTARSNPSDDLCDTCYDSNPMRVMGSGHGVAWRTNSAGIPN